MAGAGDRVVRGGECCTPVPGSSCRGLVPAHSSHFQPAPLTVQLVLVFPRVFWPRNLEVLNHVAPSGTPGAWSETYNMLPHTGECFFSAIVDAPGKFRQCRAAKQPGAGSAC